MKEGSHTFCFQNVWFAYPGSEVSVLKGVNLSISPSEHLSVVGLSGAGKTTFIKLLCRLYDPTEGEILMDGVDIREYDYEEYMKVFAPVFQDFKLFAFSIQENLVLGNAAGEDKRAAEMLGKAGLTEKLASLEKGADTALFKHYEGDGIEPSGVVKEYGTHGELAGRENGIYAGMFAAQAQYYV